MLHGLGAEVIKIELPQIGDVGRHVGMIEDLGHTSVFIACNRDKRSATLDLRVPAGREAFLKLVETADVVLSNFKPGTLDEWGLSYDDLAAVNPRIIWAAGSFLGPVGPDADREGADIAGQASGGVIASSGYDGGPLATYGTLVADHCGAQNLQTGILAALYARERTGRGQRVDVSLLGGQIWLQAVEYTHLLLTGEEAGRSNGGHPLVHALYGIFPTADGYIAMAGCPEHLWPGMCEAIERPDLVDHPTWNAYFVPREVAIELRAFFTEVFQTRSTEEWSKRLEAAEQRFCPVRTHSEVVASDQPYANKYLVKAPNEEWGPQTWVGCPITMTDTPTRTGTWVAELGQHTEEVLLEAGAEWDQLEQWREAGAW